MRASEIWGPSTVMSVTPDARSEGFEPAGILTDFDQHARRERRSRSAWGVPAAIRRCEARRLDRHAIDFVELCVHKRTIRPSPKAEDQLAYSRALRVEAGGRLVEQDDAWLVQEAARERDALPQPLRGSVGLSLARSGMSNSANASSAACRGDAGSYVARRSRGSRER